MIPGKRSSPGLIWNMSGVSGLLKPWTFDDLILCTVRLLLEDEDVRHYYQQYFRYVLVDEYQDTSNLQYLLASTLAGGYDNICVVGDDDQSIYRFRGATIENILSFEKRYKNARCIKLEQELPLHRHTFWARPMLL